MAKPKTYELRYRDGSGYVTTVQAYDLDGARKEAREDVLEGDWDTSEGTVWVDVGVHLDGAHLDTVTVVIRPREPRCINGAVHDWCAPHALVGGDKSNPGVVGHDGGLRIHSVCRRCGWHRHEDTWATRPDTGEQGLYDVCYVGPDRDSVEWVSALAAEGE